jgi:hypothetical protein
MGGLSPVLYRLVVPPAMLKMVKTLGVYQNLGVRLKFTDFSQTIAVYSAFLGTDEDSLPIPAGKSKEDGRYHLYGDLQLAPPPLCLQILPETNGKSAYICGGSKSRLYNTVTKVCPVRLLQRRWTCV